MKNIQEIFEYLEELMEWRAKNPEEALSMFTVAYNPKKFEGNFLGDYLALHNLEQSEAVLLALAFAEHLRPNLFDEVDYEDNESAFMFHTDSNNRLRATGETAQFIIAGKNIEERIRIVRFFEEGHIFTDNQIVGLYKINDFEPVMKGRLVLSNDAFERLTFGTDYIPAMSQDFPAEHIDTALDWEDLILPQKTLDHIQAMELWLQYNQELLDNHGMAKRLKPGYKVLFHGPPGTGKTLAATLLGKHTNRPVFRIDLSALVSKYIGETEKHLRTLFASAKQRNWILFFDEADTVFGKRTAVKDSHDRYANQGVSYLLQKIETYPGMIILASNYKENIDEAFMRRFQSIVPFELPRAQERLRLWETNLPIGIDLDASVNLEQIASRYKLTGANILNVVQDASLVALSGKDKEINNDMLLDSIKKEYTKEDKVF